MKQFRNLFLGVIAIAIISCGGESKKSEPVSVEPKSTIVESGVTGIDNKGIGPITILELGEIDQTKVKAGETMFNAKCAACHAMDSKIIGPALSGVMNRRSPEWIVNMILNTEEMLKKDIDAKKLLKEYNNIPMTSLGLSEDEAKEVLEFLRTKS